MQFSIFLFESQGILNSESNLNLSFLLLLFLLSIYTILILEVDPKSDRYFPLEFTDCTDYFQLINTTFFLFDNTNNFINWPL